MNKKISQLTPATSAQSTDEFAINQGGTTKKVTLAQVSNSGSLGLGWARYDDNEYTSGATLTVVNGTDVVLPNNAANVVESGTGLGYYDSATQKVIGTNENDLYLTTIVFKAKTANANQTHGHINLESAGPTPYERLEGEFNFPKGNDIEHNEHFMFQYYVDSDFVSNGAQWKVVADGGDIEIWDIIFFISKVQSYA